VGSCGGDDGSALTRQQFCQEKAKRECADVVPACLITEVECRASREAACNNEAGIDLSAQRTFSPSNAATCLGKVSEIYGKLDRGAVALTADDWRLLKTGCERVFQGSALLNQACNQTTDCSGPLVCDRGYCGSPKKVSAGAGCANTGEYCEPGNYCSNEPRALCTVRLGFGGACSATVPCLENLRCDRAAAMCTTLLADSSPCLSDSDCASGFCEPFALRCSHDVRFASGTPACIAFASSSPSRGSAVSSDAAAD
jgi:hypothetical protein